MPASPNDLLRSKRATPLPGLRPEVVALRAVSPHECGWFRRLGWVSSDEFSLRYSDLVTGSYDCVDRIVLNAFFPLGHNPGGFRAGGAAGTATATPSWTTPT